MRKEEILILGREDMFETKRDKDIYFIEFPDFKVSQEIFQKNNIIMFIDDNEENVILKNRYAKKMR